jgi:hypothetical protein
VATHTLVVVRLVDVHRGHQASRLLGPWVTVAWALGRMPCRMPWASPATRLVFLPTADIYRRHANIYRRHAPWPPIRLLSYAWSTSTADMTIPARVFLPTADIYRRHANIYRRHAP